MISPELMVAIMVWSVRLELPPGLLEALVAVESNGEVCAMRYEPHYRWLYRPASVKPQHSSLDTEKTGQKFSYGPLQIMGATAREMGYRGWLSELCGPRGVEYGARYLKMLYTRHENWPDAIAAYNAGSPRRTASGTYRNQAYVNKVNAAWQRS